MASLMSSQNVPLEERGHSKSPTDIEIREY